MIRAPKPPHLAWCGKNQRQYVRRLHFHQMSASFHIPFEYTEHFINAFIRVGFALFFTAIAAHFPAQDTNKKKPLNFCTISIGTDSRKYPQGQGLLTIHYFDFYCTSLWLFSSVCFVEYPFRCHPCMFVRLIGSWNSRCLLYASDNGEYNRRKDDKKNQTVTYLFDMCKVSFGDIDVPRGHGIKRQ